MKEYKIIRSNRKTIAIQINANGEILVRCPRRMRMEAIREFVERKEAWIEKHCVKLDAVKEPPYTTEEILQFRKSAWKVVEDRVAHYAPIVGVTYNRISIRAQHTRWGSCSSKGNLNFNCLLVLVPPEVLDYVVVHELCHRKQMNHAKAFWAEVEAVLPDYKTSKGWLRENGGKLMARLPDSV